MASRAGGSSSWCACGAAKLASKPGARVTVIAVGHSAASDALPDGRVRMPTGLPTIRTADQRSGAAPPAWAWRGRRKRSSAISARPTSSGIAGLTPTLLACLALFDVLEPVDERYSYRDLVAAREAGRLLAQGIALRHILEASIALRRRGSHLAETRLAEGPRGELLRELSGQLAELSGQFNMPLEQQARSLDDVVAEAEEAEERNDHATAETPLRHRPARGFERPGHPLQPRQRVRRAGPRGRGQDRLADRGRARSGVRGGLVQPRDRGGGRRPRRPRHRANTAAPCRPSRTMPTPSSISACC